MSIFNDKSLKSVAEAAAKIMEASAKKADKDYDQDGKVESPKAEVLGSRIRAAKMAGKLKEEEQIDELSKGTLASYAKKGALDSVMRMGQATEKGDHKGAEKAGKRYGGVVKAVDRLAKEEVELDEAFPTVADGEKSLKAKEGKTSKGTLIKTKTGVRHERDYDDTPEPEEKRGRGRPTGSKSGAKKRLSEMRQEYFNYFEEEVDNETFKKELDDQKAKFDGKKKGGDVAKPAVQAVKQEEVEQIDEISSNLADKWLSSSKGGNKYKKNTGSPGSANQTTHTYPDEKTYFKHKKSVNRAVSRVAELPHHKKPSYYKEEQMDEVAPPGREDQVKALKKVPGIDNPWAVSWASYRKSHPKKD